MKQQFTGLLHFFPQHLGHLPQEFGTSGEVRTLFLSPKWSREPIPGPVEKCGMFSSVMYDGGKRVSMVSGGDGTPY